MNAVSHASNKDLPAQACPSLATGSMPKHVAFIMDGNGRWAQRQGLGRCAGHLRGAEATVNIVQTTFACGVRYVTLYLFSTENWKRPFVEVENIMFLLEDFLSRFDDYLQRQKVQLKTIGQRDKLSPKLLDLLDKVGYHPQANEEEEEEEERVLCLALSYGGRDDIVQACQQLLQEGIDPSRLDEDLLRQYTALGRAGLPDPDLVVRSSGERRLSNFLLYNVAYSELVVTSTLWPDVSTEEVKAILTNYASRERRYGGLPSSSSCG
eukprot:scaffold247_cov172-Ochromonas_danica.AAC.24